jgi:hypothetical protein
VVCANRTDATDCDLYFNPLLEGYSTSYFKFVPHSKDSKVKTLSSRVVLFKENYKIGTNKTLTVSPLNGELTLTSCTNPKTCISENFSVRYNYYESYQNTFQNSGAYIFRPSKETISESIEY